MDLSWNEIFGISSPGNNVRMDCDDCDAGVFSSASSSPSSFTEQRVKFITNHCQFKGSPHDPVLSVAIHSKAGRDMKKALFKFDISGETDPMTTEKYIRGFRSVRSSAFSVQVYWNGSSLKTEFGHHIIQFLDCLNTLALVTDLRVCNVQSTDDARRLATYLQTNSNLSCFQLGYHMSDRPEIAESANILGRALGTNSSLKEFRFLPFSASTDSKTFHDNFVDQAIRSILHGVSQNSCLERLYLWAPGMIPSSIVEATIVDHPSIIELHLDGETAPWYRGEGVGQYHEFQHLVWKMLCSPLCRLEKLRLYNFHLNTRTVDVLLSSLWQGHPLQVLDVSGNFLSSLHFPRFLEQHPCDESNDRRLRLLVVERQCNSFASLEYDLTYNHDQTRCRQHCHDMMKLLSAKPGLSIQHSKIPAMLQSISILPTILPPPLPSRLPTRFTCTGQLQWMLDHHRVVPPQIRKVKEDFCLGLWPLILERCTTIGWLQSPMDLTMVDSVATARRRQASVLYQIFQDWSFLLLIQGGSIEKRRDRMIDVCT
jgi:hypothetical protein